MKAVVHYHIKKGPGFQDGVIKDMELGEAIAFAKCQKQGGVVIFIKEELLLTFHNGSIEWANGPLLKEIGVPDLD